MCLWFYVGANKTEFQSYRSYTHNLVLRVSPHFSAVVDECFNGFAVLLLAVFVQVVASHELIFFRRVCVIGRFCRTEQFSALGCPSLPSF